MRVRKRSPVWVAMLVGLTSGCTRSTSRAGVELADRQREVTPPTTGALLEPFRFRSPSGDAVAWDADRALRVAGGAPQKHSFLFLHVFQPDCEKCQALARALESEIKRGALGSASVIGVAHRGEGRDAEAFVDVTGVSYPIAVGTGTDWARRWGRGDPLFVIDRTGKVMYAQVGFHEADPAIWRKVAADTAAARPVQVGPAGRQQLRPGDRLPIIALPDLMHTGHTMTLAAVPDGLAFRDHTGRVCNFRAAVGFFSRY